jgi:hypothetical protein
LWSESRANRIDFFNGLCNGATAWRLRGVGGGALLRPPCCSHHPL